LNFSKYLGAYLKENIVQSKYTLIKVWQMMQGTDFEQQDKLSIFGQIVDIGPNKITFMSELDLM
jgi:hypothetical protein